MSITIECPQCENETLEVTVDEERNYGADADGRRGSLAYFCEIDQSCDCELDSYDTEQVEEKAIEIYQEG